MGFVKVDGSAVCCPLDSAHSIGKNDIKSFILNIKKYFLHVFLARFFRN